jgi:cell division protein FtsL
METESTVQNIMNVMDSGKRQLDIARRKGVNLVNNNVEL